MSISTPETNAHVTIFFADWCPFCQRLLADLQARELPFDLVDVEQDEAASEWVKSVNDGNRIVPTVLYSDGTTATNPAGQEVADKFAELSA